jgi:hypothetical protein
MTSIWDLRRGDYDDNRMSPQGGGLRSLILSAAFEFNFLKVLIVFLALIIAPALLAGLALALAVSYGRLFLHARTMAGSSPALGLALAALLIGFALWVGRPLLRLGLDNVQQLHYTLIFPIFVALRELLRKIAEQFYGRSITPEQLNHGRRIGSVVAALVFAGAGLALLFTAWSSFGLQVINPARIQPWILVKAALVNAAIVFGFSTAVASLVWLKQEVTLSDPVLDWTPEPVHGKSPEVRIAHLSDLHIVGERYGYRMEAGTHGPQGNECIARTLRQLEALQAQAPMDRILVTGDITDAGTRAEWAEFIDLLEDYPELRSRLSFIPGNHDVNVVDRTNPGRMDLPWSASQSLRKLRTLLALDMVQGDRAHLIDRTSGTLGPSLRDYLREDGRAERLRSLAERGSIRGRWEMEKVWDAIFPLVEPPQAGSGYGVILLDSNARTHLSLTNAIGFITPAQLRALRSVLRSCANTAWIIALHHQVVEYPVASISLADRIGLALVNASDVLAVIGPHASHIVVLHGHRHRDWIGDCGGLVLCSAPSAALGSQSGEKYHGAFFVHDFIFGTDGSIRLTKTDHVKVADERKEGWPLQKSA